VQASSNCWQLYAGAGWTLASGMFCVGWSRNILVCVMNMSCLFVCRFVCLFTYLKNCMLLWPWLGPPLIALLYIIYFWFCGCHTVDSVVHLCIPKQWEHNIQKYFTDFNRILFNDKSQQVHIVGYTLGAKSAIYDFLVWRLAWWCSWLIPVNEL